MLGKKTYKNGQKVYEIDGEKLTYYFKDGSKKAEGPYINEKKEGEWVFYRQNGVVWQYAHFKNDKKHGLWITYDREGKIEKEQVFEMGKEKK